MNGFRQSHAVVIGINGYGNGIPQLRTAVNDARRIAEVLETEFGYSVQLLTEDVTLAKAQSPPRRVLAAARSRPTTACSSTSPAMASRLDGDDGPAGYLVPQDARRRRSTELPADDRPEPVARSPSLPPPVAGPRLLLCRRLPMVQHPRARSAAGGHPQGAVRPLHPRPGLAGDHVGGLRPEGPRRPLRRGDRPARTRGHRARALAVRRGLPARTRRARPTSTRAPHRAEPAAMG